MLTNGTLPLINGKKLEDISKKVNGLLIGYNKQSINTVKQEVINTIDDINNHISIIDMKINEIIAIFKDLGSNGIAEYECNVEQYIESMDWYNSDSEHDAIQMIDSNTGQPKRYVNSKEVCDKLSDDRDQFKDKYIKLNKPEGGLHGVVIQLHHPDRNNNQPELFYVSHPDDYSQITENMSDASGSIVNDVFVTPPQKMSLNNFASMPKLLKKEDAKNGTLEQRNYIREYLINVQKIYPEITIKSQGEINILLLFLAEQFGIPKKIKNLQLLVLGLMLGGEYGYFSYKDGSFFRLSSECDGRYIRYVSQGGESFKLLMKLS